MGAHPERNKWALAQFQIRNDGFFTKPGTIPQIASEIAEKGHFRAGTN